MKILQAQALSALFHKSNKNKSFGFPCCVRKTRTFKNWITECNFYSFLFDPTPTLNWPLKLLLKNKHFPIMKFYTHLNNCRVRPVFDSGQGTCSFRTLQRNKSPVRKDSYSIIAVLKWNITLGNHLSNISPQL